MIKVVEFDAKGNIITTCVLDESTIKDDFLKRDNIKVFPEDTNTNNKQINTETGELEDVPFVYPTELEMLCDEIACAPLQFLERITENTEEFVKVKEILTNS